MSTSSLLIVHAVTPLHAGIGQGVGDIDLPIARERSTGVPYLPGSSIKGALRALATEEAATKLFGPSTDRADEHSGSVQISDARLLFLPVRSMRGVFAYVTSPLLLRRYLRDRADAGAVKSAPELPNKTIGDSACTVAKAGCVLEHEKRVFLEDMRFGSQGADFSGFDTLGRLLGIDGMASRVCIVSDDVMSFLADTATELRARIRLDEDARSVAKGALWYEEALPAEAILTGVVYARSVTSRSMTIGAKEALTSFEALVRAQKAVQLGGKATVGRGVCRLVPIEGGAS